ncbi:unnamed protein product [Dibothriocephalus latus]|uniref:Uncharacterized protein n=1 Tax=Dibothriocephalus latus TaxID=60516 RepID=A0A3P6QZK9_DIBLA|nr:unnamed protein product [Dibothriocephalus latus]
MLSTHASERAVCLFLVSTKHVRAIACQKQVNATDMCPAFVCPNWPIAFQSYFTKDFIAVTAYAQILQDPASSLPDCDSGPGPLMAGLNLFESQLLILYFCT